jgi:hypothetical protein
VLTTKNEEIQRPLRGRQTIGMDKLPRIKKTETSPREKRKYTQAPFGLGKKHIDKLPRMRKYVHFSEG